MKILITGGCGFIGSNFIKYWLEKYPEDKIINLDKLTYAGNLDNLKDMEDNENYEFVKGDICDKALVENLMEDVDIVFNFAAESHVDNSIKGPMVFTETNVLGTHNLLEAVKNNKIKKFIHISCYDEKTRALTTEGFKTYKELKKGDKVISINPKTQEIEIKPIENIIIQEYKGKMIHFKNKRNDIFVTPDHNMFHLRTNKKKICVESAKKASERCFFCMPRGRWVGKDKSFTYIKNIGKVKTSDLLYILGIFIGDGFTAYQEKKIESISGLNRKEFLEKARDRYGKFTKIKKQENHKTVCKGFRVFFDIPEKDKCRKKVEKVLSNLKIKYQCHKGKAGTHLYFTSKPWMKLFNQCGKGAYNKKIPRWVLEYSPKYLKFLLGGLIDSDGYKKGKIMHYHTVSKQLVANISELCFKLNLNPSIYVRYVKSFIGKRKIKGSCFSICVSTTDKNIFRRNIKEVNYEGNIWCLKVKDNKNFIIERNGKLNFCGNTDEVYGSTKDSSFKETDLVKPNSPYSASKAAAEMIVRAYNITFKLPTIITRSSNNFGPYQYPEKVIPLFVTNLIEGKKVPLYGTGKNVRDWIYVKDNCEAIDFISKKGKTGEIYNIGGGNEIENIELTKKILKEMKKDESFIKYVEDRLAHDFRYSLNCDKIHSLGWKPRHNFDEALEKTIKWYKENEEWWRKLKK